MGKIVIILLVVVGVFFVIGYLSGDKDEKMESGIGAALGAGAYGVGCLFQLFMAGMAIAIGLWLFSAIFG